MKISNKSWFTRINIWLPFIILTGIASISAYKAYKIHTTMNTIRAETSKTDIRLLALKTDLIFNVLLVLAASGASVSHNNLLRQGRDSQELIARINWTVERLAALESKKMPSQPLGEIRWPWGNHHTEALGHLEAAAKRFWTDLYDPSDPSTAPTNDMVERWLITERGVSKQKAAAIASILRLDGLRTGPR
ncbi:hypothetical protein [Acidovorax sp. NCPPB 3576]|uniref:hypothetical protein n=1 Tax=Acidovorax sp. NCPPB 3576 TaxID=2940488 RepID=UPI00234AD83F|nr:hypothetical protein [Acidovorax sp. NCPPB 3576]WCM86681.1 hypothetical protein M5C98_14975 [Acidovorax sp. NCPPB 3576]